MPAAITAFFLGGTISMSGTTGDGSGAVTRFGAAELVAAVPALADLDVTLDARDFTRVPSACIRPSDISRLVDDAAASGADGIVVVQGTDTLEETSYLFDLLWPHDTPVVFTGAMRNPTLAGPDGPANLLAAVTTAAEPRFRGLGALVAFNDEIHAARYVRKTHSTNVSTFASPNAGPIGLLVEGRAVPIATIPRRRTHAPTELLTHSVPIFTVGLGDDGALLRTAEVDGLVVAGFGVGHVPDRLAGTIGAFTGDGPVVLATRAAAGPVLERTYGYEGSERDLLARGLISAGLLDAFKARLLLLVCLACGYDDATIRAVFAEASGLG
ncbi:MAG TPA: asparaginase [Jatrophihabitans sp.]|nr:asparaginase [Jatrophihabitans sp.]